MADEKKPNIFQKALAATDVWLNSQIAKGQETVKQELEDEHDFFYRKSVSKDQSYYIGSQGYQEKPHRLTFEHLKQMALKDSVISAIIQTRQNQISGFSRCVQTPFEKGFKITLKDYDGALDIVKQMIRDGMEEEDIIKDIAKKVESESDNVIEITSRMEKSLQDFRKSKEEKLQKGIMDASKQDEEEEGDIPDKEEEKEDQRLREEWRIARRAKRLLDEAIKPRKRYLEQYITNCGIKKDRPFESRRWNFNSLNRAIVRDSLQYDQFGIEVVPNLAGKPHP
jgi:hypothetical protein